MAVSVSPIILCSSRAGTLFFVSLRKGTCKHWLNLGGDTHFHPLPSISVSELIWTLNSDLFLWIRCKCWGANPNNSYRFKFMNQLCSWVLGYWLFTYSDQTSYIASVDTTWSVHCCVAQWYERIVCCTHKLCWSEVWAEHIGMLISILNILFLFYFYLWTQLKDKWKETK